MIGNAPAPGLWFALNWGLPSGRSGHLPPRPPNQRNPFDLATRDAAVAHLPVVLVTRDVVTVVRICTADRTLGAADTDLGAQPRSEMPKVDGALAMVGTFAVLQAA